MTGRVPAISVLLFFQRHIVSGKDTKIFYQRELKQLYGGPMNGDEKGTSELVDETLIIALGIVLALVIAVMVFGVLIPTEKTAYLIPRFGVGNLSGQTIITIFNRGGDPVYFNSSPLAKYQAELYVDTQSGSYKAANAPTLTLFKPGDTIYAYYTGTGFVLTETPAGVTFISLPAGKITVRLVDATSGVLIAKEELLIGAGTPAPTPATTMATTSTTTTTTTPGTTTTATTTTTTTTAPPVPLAANFNWFQAGSSTVVHFTDTSVGSPASWSWSFGAGTSTHRNPNYNFGTPGSYSVTLTVTRSADGATSSITKTVTVV